MALVDIPENPMPDGALPGDVATADGARLRYARWHPTNGELRGTVCLFTGRGEFIEKYYEVIGELRERGFTVAAVDWRGQGGSRRLLKDPRKGHIRDFAQYDRDLEAFMERVVLPDCPPPMFGLAHSMGAHILLRNAWRRPGWFERMVLSAPLIALATGQVPGWLPRKIARILSFVGFGRAYVPGGGGVRPSAELPFEDNPYTSDPVRYARTRATVTAAPHLTVGAPTVAWVAAATRSLAQMEEPDFPSKVALPVLMVAAGADRIVSNRAIESLAMQLKTGDHLVLPGARHEILMERHALRQQFWAAFDAFVPGSPAFE